MRRPFLGHPLSRLHDLSLSETTSLLRARKQDTPYSPCLGHREPASALIRCALRTRWEARAERRRRRTTVLEVVQPGSGASFAGPRRAERLASTAAADRRLPLRIAKQERSSNAPGLTAEDRPSQQSRRRRRRLVLCQRSTSRAWVRLPRSRLSHLMDERGAQRDCGADCVGFVQLGRPAARAGPALEPEPVLFVPVLLDVVEFPAAVVERLERSVEAEDRSQPCAGDGLDPVAVFVTYVPTHERPINWDICPEPQTPPPASCRLRGLPLFTGIPRIWWRGRRPLRTAKDRWLADKTVQRTVQHRAGVVWRTAPPIARPATSRGRCPCEGEGWSASAIATNDRTDPSPRRSVRACGDK